MFKKIFLSLMFLFFSSSVYALNLANNSVAISTSTGYVGINNTSPGEKLDVTGGNIRTSGQFISTATFGTAPLVVTSSSMVTNLNANYLGGYPATSLVLPTNMITGTGVLNYMPLFNSTGTLTSSVMYQTANNIGIGTATPGISKLYVSNDMSNVGVYIGTGTPAGQAKLEMDGGTGTHIWISENGIVNSVFTVGVGGLTFIKGTLSVDNEINSKIKSLTVNVNIDTKITEITTSDAGKLFIVKAISTNNKIVGIFELSLQNGVGYSATKVSGTLFSGTKDNASTVNVYWQSLGDAGFYVQNKLSENITVTIASYTAA